MDGAGDDEDGAECEGLMLDTEVDSSRDCSHGDCMSTDGAEDGDVTGNCSAPSSARMASEGLPGMEKDEGLREQLAMVEAMVQEMKVGFMAALEQLSSMQDGDQGIGRTLESTCQRQDQQITDLSQSLDSLRQEVSALTSNVGKVISTQQSLQDKLSVMQTSQQHLLDELVSTGVLSDKSRTALSQSEISDTVDKLPTIDIVLDNVNNHGNQPDDATNSNSGQNEGDNTGVTAAACKSLSLTQALAARCQDIDVSDSSEDDLESSSPRRKHHGDDRQYTMADSSADAAQRRQAVQEIVDSEEEYCAQLWTVVNVYQVPLQEGHYMSSRHLHVLFPSPLSELCEQHSQMLHSLQDRLVHWCYAGVVGDVFARMTDSNSNLLGLYQEYVESLPASISFLRRQLAQSRSFRAFVKAQRETNGETDLLSLLISPLQRIPKYMLQLQQVLRHTHEDHPDHFNLQASLCKLQDFVERFNHDITHTTQAIALDLQHLQAHGSSFRSSASGSSCEVLPVTTSTRDSGIHSAEDTFPRRSQHNGHFEQDMYLPNWLEQSTAYRHMDPRHVHVMGVHRRVPRQSRLASHSQPDLTYSGYSVAASPFDPQATVPQIRSQSKLAPAADRSARQRRYKIKKRIEGQGRYLSQSPSPHMRPASAIDFVTQKEPQQRPEREQVIMRPHSVLGPFPGDGRNRVIQVYSRKQARVGQRQSDSDLYTQSSVPSHHHTRGSPQPHVMVNGHWDPVGGGDQGLNDRNYPLVDYTYDDEEDDTRAMSDTHSHETSSSHKLSSRHSQDAHETETDNSDDYTQEDLAASLSQHLASGSLQPKATSTWTNSESQQLHYIANKLQVNGYDNDTDYMESPESGVIVTTDLHLSASNHQQHQPFEDMSELKLDLTCFHNDNEGQTSSVKKSSSHTELKTVKETVPDPQAALSMQPMAVNMNNSAEVASRSQDPPPQHQQREEHVISAEAPAKGRTAVPNSSASAANGSSAAVNSDSMNGSAAVNAGGEEKVGGGSVVLDELEREYTKELVRQCLTKNGHTHGPTVHPTTTTTTKAADADHTATSDRGCADGGEATTHTSVCDNDKSGSCVGDFGGVIDTSNNNNNNNVLHCNNHSNGFFAKMRRSPLFLFYRNSAEANTDTAV
nr:hypothetical protein BaRGS_007500 [Batillaria attramentaria]